MQNIQDESTVWRQVQRQHKQAVQQSANQGLD